MKTRIITAVIGIILVVALMIFGEMFPIIFAIAMALVNALLCMEYLTAKSLQKNKAISITTIVFSLGMPLVACTNFWTLPIFLFALVMFSFLIFLRPNITLGDITFSFSGVMIISMCMSCISRLILCSGGHNSFYLVMAVVSPWCADSAAYFVGSFMGKRKLCPNISPNKTVEGALGGVIGSVVGIMIAGLVFHFLVYKDITVNYLALLVIGFYCSVVSVIGDLVFSVIKRECGIKDYGSIMPGHGGLLDRFDSVIFCAPFVYLISENWGLLLA